MARPTAGHVQGRLLYGKFKMLILLCSGCILFVLFPNVFGGAATTPNRVSRTWPKKIWQSWKVEPLRFEARDAERASTWTVKNPGYRYECLTDDNAAEYVQHHFGPEGFNRPDIVSIYTGLQARIIQADLLRYLIMFVEGGVWADIDVEAIRPVEKFVPKRFQHLRNEIGLIIGVETDEPGLLDHPVLGSKAQSFCQWTFVAAPRLPVMMRLIDNILIWLSKLSVEQGKPIPQLTLDFDEVLSGTGPSAFTKAILADMSARTGRNVTWDEFHDMDESKIVGNTLVLTSQAFAAGTGHSASGNHDGRAALVKHHFHASSWTTNHPRYKHPIYGEVEKCNWDLECIKLWDANTAFFAALPKEDQMKMIAMKDRDEAEAAIAPMVNQAPELPMPIDLEAIAKLESVDAGNEMSPAPADEGPSGDTLSLEAIGQGITPGLEPGLALLPSQQGDTPITDQSLADGDTTGPVTAANVPVDGAEGTSVDHGNDAAASSGDPADDDGDANESARSRDPLLNDAATGGAQPDDSQSDGAGSEAAAVPGSLNRAAEDAAPATDAESSQAEAVEA